jgi:hypothetical protein
MGGLVPAEIGYGLENCRSLRFGPTAPEAPCPLATVLSLQQPSPFVIPSVAEGICGTPVPVPQAQGLRLSIGPLL